MYFLQLRPCVSFENEYERCPKDAHLLKFKEMLQCFSLSISFAEIVWEVWAQRAQNEERSQQAPETALMAKRL
jgi:hypothetical protein